MIETNWTLEDHGAYWYMAHGVDYWAYPLQERATLYEEWANWAFCHLRQAKERTLL